MRQCDMVVLDEVLGLLDLGLLKTEELVEMLENRSDDQTIIMTGRQIPEALIPYADEVYEIQYDQRILMLMLHRMIGRKEKCQFLQVQVLH